MRYDKRCTLIKIETVNGPLGQTETEIKDPAACAKQNVSLEEQTSIYGQTGIETLKLHFRGQQKGYERVEYPRGSDKEYNISLERHFRNATVMYLKRSSHSG